MAQRISRPTQLRGRARAHFKAGSFYFEQKKYPEALVEFQEALQINPNLLSAQIRVGDVYFAKKSFPRLQLSTKQPCVWIPN